MKALALLLALAGPAAAADAPAPDSTAPRPVVSVIVNPQTGLPVTYVGTVAARIETLPGGDGLSALDRQGPLAATWSVDLQTDSDCLGMIAVESHGEKVA